MCKKLLVLVIILLLIFSLVGCNDLGLGNALALDEKEHLFLNCVNTNGIEYATYQNNTYYSSNLGFLFDGNWTPQAKGDYEYVYIGWTGSRFGYHSLIYGNSLNTPIFLYSSRTGKIYLREDYDYRSDVFLIEKTEETLNFRDDILDTDYCNTNLFNRESKEIILSSVTHPSLWVKLFVVKDEDKWYAITSTMLPFELSNRTVTVLLNNNIIP